jgi:hypothetical protein
MLAEGIETQKKLMVSQLVNQRTESEGAVLLTNANILIQYHKVRIKDLRQPTNNSKVRL